MFIRCSVVTVRDMMGILALEETSVLDCGVFIYNLPWRGVHMLSFTFNGSKKLSKLSHE